MFGSSSSSLWDAGLPEQTSIYKLQADFSELTGLCQGDFYRESDDVVRGVSLPTLPPPMFAGSGCQKGFFETEPDGFRTCDLALRQTDGKDTSLVPMKEQFQATGEGSETFQACFLPPAPPSSQHFHFEPTTLSLEGALPHEIANRVLTFLRSQVISSITKVRPVKYTISADVFQDGKTCALKVRVYHVSDAPSRYSVEFQRRSGCAIAFNSVYQRAADFLGAACDTQCCQSTGSGVQQLPELLPLPNDEMELDFEDVVPLLEMARSMSLQAEAACALSRLVDNGRGSAEPLLQQPQETAMALEQLIISSSLAVAYPAACTLMSLASYEKSGPLLATPGLLQAALRGACTQERPSSVRDALAQSVGIGVRSCATTSELAQGFAAELCAELEGALQSSAVPTSARGHLEEALFTLREVPCH